MGFNLEDIVSLVVWIVPIAIVVFVVYFFRQKQIFETISIHERIKNTLESKEPTFYENIKHLLPNDDISLRLLEEIFAVESERFYYYEFSQNHEARRSVALKGIQRALRLYLKDSIKSENFPIVKVNVLKLIDEAQKEIDTLQQRKPFEGLDEPEKSLLVDLLSEIPTEKSISRQKALQLADIIKLKHQDIRKLQLENASSASWTRWGTFGTIFFGVVSIVLTIYTILPSTKATAKSEDQKSEINQKQP